MRRGHMNHKQHGKKFLLGLFTLLISWSLIPVQAGDIQAPAAAAEQVFPGKSWERIQDPESIGYNTQKLA